MSNDKNDLRDFYKRARIHVTDAQKSSQEGRILHRAWKWLSVGAWLSRDGKSSAHGTIGLYAPTQGEVDLRPLAIRLNEAQMDVAFPRVLPGKRMEFCRIDNIDDLAPGSYGILEPPADHPTVDHAMLSVVFVPGLAFSLRGNRLGYGGGYYDRYFSSHAHNMIRIGVCFQQQLADYLPEDAYDVPMDYVLTDGGMVRCQIRTL